mgnify:FL=1
MRKLRELEDFLDRRGVTMTEFIRICLAASVLLGVTGILIYGAIGAMLS